MTVHIEPGGDRWARLQHWLKESMEAIDRADFSRLPESFAGQPVIAREAYESVLMAMEIIDTGYLRQPKQ